MWRAVRHGFTLCFCIVRPLSKETEQCRLTSCSSVKIVQSTKTDLPQKLIWVYFLDFLDLATSQALNNTSADILGFLTRWIFMSWGCNSSSDFTHMLKYKPHRQIESFLLKAWRWMEENMHFYSLIASLGWGNWVPPPLTEWIMTSSDPWQGLENLD